MSNNNYYLEIITQINKIKNDKFEIKTLRTAIEITNKTKYFFYKNKISKKELNNIYKLLKNTIKSKLLELNPNLTEKVINNICKCYERDYDCLPNDISIINNDIVFYQENNFGNPYETNVFLLNDKSKKEFKEVNDFKINEQEIELTTKIITLIDEILRYYFIFSEKNLLSIKNNKIISNNGIKAFININLDNGYNKQNYTIKLAILENWNEFHLLDINLTFLNNEIINYSWKKIDTDIWNLKEELEKTNNSQNRFVRKKTQNKKTD